MSLFDFTADDLKYNKRRFTVLRLKEWLGRMTQGIHKPSR